MGMLNNCFEYVIVGIIDSNPESLQYVELDRAITVRSITTKMRDLELEDRYIWYDRVELIKYNPYTQKLKEVVFDFVSQLDE